MIKYIILFLILSGCSELDWVTRSLQHTPDEKVVELQAKLITRNLSNNYYDEEGYPNPHGLSFQILDLFEMGEFERVKFECDKLINIGLIGGYDEIRKKHMLGFLNRHYTKGKAYFWLLHSGKLLEGCVKYALAVGDTNMLNKSDIIMGAFESDWKGEYYYEPYIKTYSPYNMMATYVITYDLLGYHDRADKVALFLKSAFRYEKKRGKKYLVWNYKKGHSRIEDSGHYMADLRFVTYMYEQGRVFTKFDIERVMATLSDLAIDSNYNLRGNIDGSGGYLRSAASVCSYSVTFFRYNLNLFKVCESIE